MKRHTVRLILLCAFLAVGLLLDPLGILRMTLMCAALHEGGHILAYRLCAHGWPRLRLSLEGVSLSGARPLSRARELWVLCAGPMANFLFAALLLLRLQDKASYRLYFLAAVSLCTGLYNLLPFGVLDGARILQNLLPAERLGLFRRAQRALLGAFCAGTIWLLLRGDLPFGARAAALLGPGYLLAREFFGYSGG